MRRPVLLCLCLNALLFVALPTLCRAADANATLSAGAPAPPLRLTQLLQAPPNARTTWPALRGKVVVLEFWATWCAPCIAEIPHLNQLVATLDPRKFQFISIDDEDPRIIVNFLAKKKMDGWIGIDTTGEIFKRFGALQRPTTVIVDQHGNIAAITHPESLKASDLVSIAASKSVVLAPPPDTSAISAALKSSTSGVAPLFEISLSKAATADTMFVSHASSGKIEIHAVKPDYLLSLAYNLPADRFIFTSPVPDGTYSLVEVPGSGQDSIPAPVVQAAVTSGLHLQATEKKITKTAWVLVASDASKKLLTSTAAAPNTSMQAYMNGQVRMVNGSIDALAGLLENALQAPVINETGITGNFDVDLDIPEGDGVTAKQTLLQKMGLELRQQDRPVTMIEITQAAAAVSPSKP
jgi:uncharacterized protein (TIGR03435 family)